MDKMLQLSFQVLTDISHANFLDASRFDIQSAAQK